MNLAALTRLYDFTGRVVVVTGGTGILGGEMARALAGCGARVAILSRDTALSGCGLGAPPAGGAAESEAGPGELRLVHGDVTKRDTLAEAAEAIRREWGPVDTLVNAAGGNRPGATTNDGQSFFDLAPEALSAVFDLNLLGTFLPSQAFARQMVERGEGVILNISSVASQRSLTRVPAYAAAKAAVNSFTQWLAVHMAQTYSPGIRVNAVAPGFFFTAQNRFLLTDEESGELTPRGQAILAHTPMGRFGQPEDLLGAVLWLLSPASEFVTGIVVPVDGGFSAYSGV